MPYISEWKKEGCPIGEPFYFKRRFPGDDLLRRAETLGEESIEEYIQYVMVSEAQRCVDSVEGGVGFLFNHIDWSNPFLQHAYSIESPDGPIALEFIQNGYDWAIIASASVRVVGQNYE